MVLRVDKVMKRMVSRAKQKLLRVILKWESFQKVNNWSIIDQMGNRKGCFEAVRKSCEMVVFWWFCCAKTTHVNNWSKNVQFFGKGNPEGNPEATRKFWG